MDRMFNALMLRSMKETENFENFSELKTYIFNSKEFLNLVQKKKSIPAEFLDLINEDNIVNYEKNRDLILHNYFLFNLKIKDNNDLYKLCSFFGYSFLDISEIKYNRKQLFLNFLNKILNPDVDSISIPHIHHRIWITSLENPCEYPEKELEKYVESINNFDESWTHYFWCLNPCDIPNMIKIINKCPKIIVRSLYEVLSEFKTVNLFWALHKKKYYTYCSDYCRLEIVNLFGGLYCDLGFEILKSPNFLVDNFDYTFYYHKIMKGVYNYDVTFFCSKKKSEIIENHLFINSEILNYPGDLKNKFNNILGIISIKLFLLFHLLNLKTCHNILFFHKEDIFNLVQQGSWFGECKFGNRDALFLNFKSEKIFDF